MKVEPGMAATTTTTAAVTTTTSSDCPDTDGDGWDDCYEQAAGTNPFFTDTDNDGIIDSEDPNPLLAATPSRAPGFGINAAIICLFCAGIAALTVIRRRHGRAG